MCFISNYAVLDSLDLKSKQVCNLDLTSYDQRCSHSPWIYIDPSRPSEVRRLRHEKVKFISCGEEHTAVLTQVTNRAVVIVVLFT